MPTQERSTTSSAKRVRSARSSSAAPPILTTNVRPRNCLIYGSASMRTRALSMTACKRASVASAAGDVSTGSGAEGLLVLAAHRVGETAGDSLLLLLVEATDVDAGRLDGARAEESFRHRVLDLDDHVGLV